MIGSNELFQFGLCSRAHGSKLELVIS